MNHSLLSLFLVNILVLLIQGWALVPSSRIRRVTSSSLCLSPSASTPRSSISDIEDEVDVVIIGGGIGGLCAGAVLSAVYNQKVAVHEAHYRPGGCAHSFPCKSREDGTTFMFEAGPTILLGCDNSNNLHQNQLRQILDMIGAGNEIDWIPWDGWQVVDESGSWKFSLGPKDFEEGPLKKFAGSRGVEEFRNLREACLPLTSAASTIPAKALRGDSFKIIPLLRYLDSLKVVAPYANILDGSFAPFLKYVSSPWLKNWLDALAFSLSAEPAARTNAATMAYVLSDLHKQGAELSYPRGGMGRIADVLVDVIEGTGSRVHLSSTVESITVEKGRLRRGPKADGVILKRGNRRVKAKRAVICNADVWALSKLFDTQALGSLDEKQRDFFLSQCASKKPTKSFMHLHLGLDGTGLNLSGDNAMPAHFTVMAKGLTSADPCDDRNMVAVSNPCVLDPSLCPPGKLMIHAYGAANEPWEEWAGMQRGDSEYKRKKEEASGYLFKSVSRALQISEKELRERSDVSLIGTPLTHAAFLRRHQGTYGPAFGELLNTPVTPLRGLLLASDSVFPGIGLPAAAMSGVIAANTAVSVTRHLLQGVPAS